MLIAEHRFTYGRKKKVGIKNENNGKNTSEKGDDDEEKKGNLR